MPNSTTPDVEHQLTAHVRPADWQPPTPAPRYNLVVAGGGTAGLVSALGAAGLGARVALVERHRLGGDCLNYGCVPSKALLRSARAAFELANSATFGISATHTTTLPAANFHAVMHRAQQLRASLAPHDSADRLRRAGVDVFFGNARFTSPDALHVDGRTLRFHRAVIATGTRPAMPAVSGLAEAQPLTNETVFSLRELPRRLAVIGAGPIGCELGQAFRRLGAEVQLIGRQPRLLPREDPQASARLEARFVSEGLSLYLGWNPVVVTRANPGWMIVIQRGSERRSLEVDAILVAAGRTPHLEDLGLDAASVACSRDGISVDDRLRTSNPRIYAAGDVTGLHRFTHAAEAQARLVIRNALFPGRSRASRLVIPRCIYTSPEVAHVGLTPQQAEQQGLALDSYHLELADVDRAVLDDDTHGFGVIHTRRGTGRVVGATLVASHAGDMISSVVLLMTRRLPLAALGHTVHCYPTHSEVFKRIADTYQRRRLTPPRARLLKYWFALRRR